MSDPTRFLTVSMQDGFNWTLLGPIGSLTLPTGLNITGSGSISGYALGSPDGNVGVPSIYRQANASTGFFFNGDTVNIGVASALIASFASNSVIFQTPKFSAYKSTNQALTASATAKITFDTEEFDTKGNFAGSTFTAPVAGKYQFTAAVLLTDNPATVALYLFKNGAQFKRLAQRGMGSGEIVAGSALLDLVATDTIEIYVFTDQNLTVIGASTVTYFSGIQLP